MQIPLGECAGHPRRAAEDAARLPLNSAAQGEISRVQNVAALVGDLVLGRKRMVVQVYAPAVPGLDHYDAVSALTGRQYRLTDGRRAIGIVLGRLDDRTGLMPIGLVDARNAYWAEILYYDANRRTIDMYDPAQWKAFVETYAGGGWLLGLVQALGGVSLMVVGGVGSAIVDSMKFFLVPAILFGLVGLVVYGLVGYVLAQVTMQALPYLVGGILAWLGLCGILAFERRKRCQRIGVAIETLIMEQLLPVFD